MVTFTINIPPNVSIYTLHGSYGLPEGTTTNPWFFFWARHRSIPWPHWRATAEWSDSALPAWSRYKGNGCLDETMKIPEGSNDQQGGYEKPSFYGYPLIMTNIAIENGPVKIVDLTSYKMVIVHIVTCLPEGISWKWSWNIHGGQGWSWKLFEFWIIAVLIERCLSYINCLFFHCHVWSPEGITGLGRDDWKPPIRTSSWVVSTWHVSIIKCTYHTNIYIYIHIYIYYIYVYSIYRIM